MTEPVAEPGRGYRGNDEALAKVRALRGGVTAMRKAGRTYLPQEERETNPDYENRLSRSWLYPGLDKATEDLADKIFGQKIVLNDDVPDQIVELEDNITSEGDSLNHFARRVLEDAIDAGVSYIFVDAPRVEDGVSLSIADAQMTNQRPYLTMVRAEDLVGFRTENIGGQTELSQIRIREKVMEPDPDNPYVDKEIDCIRLLERRGAQTYGQIWKMQDKAKWVVSAEFVVDLPQLTVVPVYADRTGFFTGKVTLETLADLNIAHWQSASDQRNILHKSRVPMLFGTGFQASEIVSSTNEMLITDREGAKIEFVRPPVEGIDAGRDDLSDLELRMQALGMQMVMPRTGSITATSDALDQASMDTPLRTLAQNLEDALNTALDYMAQYLGIEGGGSVTVNKDFGISALSNADHDLLLRMYQIGAITRSVLLQEIKRRGILMEDFDVDDMSEEFEDSALDDVAEAPTEDSDAQILSLVESLSV